MNAAVRIFRTAYDAMTDFQGKKLYPGGENDSAEFAVDQSAGEPTLIQTMDSQCLSSR
jgi:hypothetical protein